MSDRRQTLRDVFKSENTDKIFEAYGHSGEYIAYTYDSASDFGEHSDFSREWADRFGAGRYVILILQRHSVYKDGECIYKNDHYEAITGRYNRYKHPCYVIILDTAQEYTVPSWKSKLISHMVQDENDTLQAKIYDDITKAGKDAQRLSEGGRKAAVLGWYEDYDMY
ncbi:MAG: hypothetical protein ILP19_01470 [Oscillospiraceae bacterium]|nr:hypothetical protein [Oscillospiraceae bacterium]